MAINILFYFKNSLLCDVCFKGLQSCFHHFFAISFLFINRKIRSANWMRNRYPRNNPICTYRNRNRSNCTYMNNRNTCCIYVLNYRCTATCTSSSCRGENSTGYILTFKFFSYSNTKFSCLISPHSITHCNVCKIA